MSLGQFRTSQQKFKEGKLRYLLRAEESALPGVDAPSIYDFAKTRRAAPADALHLLVDGVRSGPTCSSPGVPKDRVDFMRKAIERAAKNPRAARRGREDGPRHGVPAGRAPRRRWSTQLYETPPELVEKAKQISPNLE